MDALKIFLNSAAGQHIRQVYLNNKMEWLFAPRPGYEKMLSREEVLAYDTIPIKSTGENIHAAIKGMGKRRRILQANTPSQNTATGFKQANNNSANAEINSQKKIAWH